MTILCRRTMCSSTNIVGPAPYCGPFNWDDGSRVTSAPVLQAMIVPTGLPEELVDLALAGRGWTAILTRLAAVSGEEVRLIGVHGRCLAAAPAPDAAGLDPAHVSAVPVDTPTPVTCLDGWRATALAVTAGPRRIGVLAVAGDRSPFTDELFAAARLAVGIEAVRRDAQAQARAESAAQLIDEVRFGVLRDPGELTRMAERFGVRLDRPHTAVAFHYDGANQRTWATALNWVEVPIRHDGRTGWTILPDDGRERSRIRVRLQGIVGADAAVRVASGSAVDTVADTTRSFFDAEVTLAVLRRRPGATELAFDDLGTRGLLFSVPRDRLARFVETRLGELRHRRDLLDTMVAWYDTNGSRAAVADRLHIHRNSVGYRLTRARDLLGLDPLDAGAVLDLQVALAASEALSILDELDRTDRGQPVHPRSD